MFIVGLDETSSDGLIASVYPAGGVGKLGGKHVGAARLLHDMTKHHVSDGFHGCQDEKWLW